MRGLDQVGGTVHVRAWIECVACQRAGPWHAMDDYPDVEGNYLVRTEDKQDYKIVTYRKELWQLPEDRWDLRPSAYTLYVAHRWTDIP